VKITIASDHGGLELKQELVKFLKEKKIEVTDLGVHSQDSVDYPDYAAQVAQVVSEGKTDSGILVCGTGIGMSIAANKFKNVRAAVVFDEFTAKMSKEHNNANVLCIGGRVCKPDLAKKMVAVWLTTKFAGGRHERRVNKISELD
jgi:ribose 5-phosphate isomerase B